MRLDIFSLFPEAFDWLQTQRPVQNALREGNELRLFNYRDSTPLTGRQVDDAPYGGGAGMVIRVDVIVRALEETYGRPLDDIRHDRRIAALAPVGRQLTDAVAGELAADERLTLLCGRYEGFDQRVHDHVATDEISIGPYVLSGGEPAAMVVIDAVTRKLPGALGREESRVVESFSQALGGALEYPHYTRPEEYRSWRVPDVLLSGHHGEVERWRQERSQHRTPGR